MFSIYKKSVEARIIGSTLVAVFHKSDTPLIWKFDLERNHSFIVTLQGEGEELELGVTSPKGEFYSVANFARREDAEQAFAAVQKVMLKRKCGWLKTMLAWIGGIALIVLFVMLLKDLFFHRDYIAEMSTAGTLKIPDGIPLPADSILRPPP